MFSILFLTGFGINSGKSWKHQRPFMMNTFRTFGVGRIQFESNITKEAETLVDAMFDQNEMPFQPHHLVSNCVSNVICSVAFGKRYEHSDPEFQYFITLLNKLFNTVGAGVMLPFLPVGKYIFPWRYKEATYYFLAFKQFVQNHIDKHRQNFDAKKLNDIMDVFLNEIELAKAESGDKTEYITLKSLRASSLILFIAGTETSSTSLQWTILYMMMYPEIQAKVQQELDTVTGRTRKPQWADRLMLPYTEAVLREILRIRTTIPLGLPHVATQDTKIAGYDIPKGTCLFSNIWALHNDPEVWTDPEEFMPERFLNKDGKLCQPEEFMPFSTGKQVSVTTVR